MSYISNSVLGRDAKIKAVKEAIELLGYVRLRKEFNTQNLVGDYMWTSETEYQSYVGVELQVYSEKSKGQITVNTRSRLGRSYWDLQHQNKTLKVLRDFFGGYFETDAGRNRYWHSEGKPPSAVAAGCYLARWRLHNALIKPRIYLQQRGMTQPHAKEEPTGIGFIDETNPRLFSNNLVLPYMFAVWEAYFRDSFISVLSSSNSREKALKKANLNVAQLEEVASSTVSVEQAVAEHFSFQRPRRISENFRMVASDLDLSSVLKKPYKRRKKSLYAEIDELVSARNEFVHTGSMNTKFTDKKLLRLISDIEAAVDRCYQEFGRTLGFKPDDGFR
ncbi:HEPN domain-containing protein [Idiomarina seosinensis]|uniref:RiboL-PSP-HEPN domain-containing protein n=1 Tax=Idiomarina seosinensis TaxID=281739 RepID=A0A432ZC00_9GAMM|nr:HEPN domain-containing protein [Idiomarina seosinensis]RUO75439.1 hypothetical protein CWI81_10735 [Idiomarina seosinensis]